LSAVRWVAAAGGAAKKGGRVVVLEVMKDGKLLEQLRLGPMKLHQQVRACLGHWTSGHSLL
jgi:hypothetical protein